MSASPPKRLTVEQVGQFLSAHAPLALAESWDNVGLLVGDRAAAVSAIMTCLTVTPAVVEEALQQQVGLIVTHHPLPFRPLQKITADTVPGGMLLKLIAGGVAVYSAHTAFDSAAEGINWQYANELGLVEVDSLQAIDNGGRPLPERLAGFGAGRLGRLPKPTRCGEVVAKICRFTGATAPRLIGSLERTVGKVAIACGSGGSFLDAARRRGCDLLITGEANFHSCLEAESTGINLLLLGHYWSERFAMVALATRIAEEFPAVRVWPSEADRDPLQSVEWRAD